MEINSRPKGRSRKNSEASLPPFPLVILLPRANDGGTLHGAASAFVVLGVVLGVIVLVILIVLCIVRNRRGVCRYR